jgi:hypothetical protein
MKDIRFGLLNKEAWSWRFYQKKFNLDIIFTFTKTVTGSEN